MKTTAINGTIPGTFSEEDLGLIAQMAVAMKIETGELVDLLEGTTFDEKLMADYRCLARMCNHRRRMLSFMKISEGPECSKPKQKRTTKSDEQGCDSKAGKGAETSRENDVYP